MTNKLISYAIIILTFVGPFRWAFLYDGESNLMPLVGFILTLAAFFIVVVLLNRDEKKVQEH